MIGPETIILALTAYAAGLATAVGATLLRRVRKRPRRTDPGGLVPRRRGCHGANARPIERRIRPLPPGGDCSA